MIEESKKLDHKAIGRKSRRKGQNAQREFAEFLREECGFKGARNGQQYKGGPGSPDVTDEDQQGIPGELDTVHIEVKRVEKLHLYPAIQQAVLEARGDQIPVVATRRNHGEWLVILRAKDYFGR